MFNIKGIQLWKISERGGFLLGCLDESFSNDHRWQRYVHFLRQV